MLYLRHGWEWRQQQQQRVYFDGLHRRRKFPAPNSIRDVVISLRSDVVEHLSPQPNDSNSGLTFLSFSLSLLCSCPAHLSVAQGPFPPIFSAPCRSEIGPALHCCSRLDSATRQHAWISPHFRFRLCLLADWSTAETTPPFHRTTSRTIDTERKRK